MRSSRIRSLLVTAVVLALGALGWLYLAPTQIGGSASYLITHGISMEPKFHAGDLVIVHPSGSYKVGQVVAYHSTLLHTVVLHRIIRIEDGRYTFKGDNNNFIDPTHPTRALLVGSMWLHIPQGGTVLQWVHKPWVAALLTGGVAMLLLFGGDQTRRRRRGRRHVGGASDPVRGPAPMTNRHQLTAFAVGAAVCAVLCIFAFVRPAAGTTTVTNPYTQELSFGYHGPARGGSVYPAGTVSTGQPVYPQLVNDLTITARYRLTTAAANRVHGTIRIRGTMSNDSGWSRSFWLGPLTRFSGDRGRAAARLDLPRLQALANRVSTQIGTPAGGFTLAVAPEVKLAGEVGAHQISAGFSPALDLALGSTELLPGASGPSSGTATGSTAGSSQESLVRSTTGRLTATHTEANDLLGVPVTTARWLSLTALVIFALLALRAASREPGATQDPAERIKSRYKHLIVPVSSVITDPDHPPIDVRTMEALAQLAERSERLILHDHQEDVDNYLIDDQGTMFRFQALRTADTKGNGNGNGKHGPVPEPAAVAGAADRAPRAESAAGEAAREDSASGLAAASAPAARTSVTAATAETEVPDESPGGAHSTAEGRDEPETDAGSVDADRELDAIRATIATSATRKARTTTVGQDEDAPAGFISASNPLSTATENPRPISSRVRPDLFAWDPQPPVTTDTHWSRRRDVQVGFALAPLLTLLAWRLVAWRQVRERRDARRAVRARRAEQRAGRARRAEQRAVRARREAPQADVPEEQTFATCNLTGRRAPGAGRRGDRRRN
jgi:signal peptidase I